MRRIKNLLKKGTSLMLVMAMLMGLCATAFAVQDNNDDGVINYVSLGDSMANGYGLDGYEFDNGDNVNGYLHDGDASYPSLFAEWLRTKYPDATVNHSAMAISAMRAEDLHFILEFPVGDAEAFAVAEGAWNKEAWNAMFSCGDYYTWDEFCTNRFHDWSGKNTNVVAGEMQGAVENADIISLGIGNANFGVFLLGRVMNALGVMVDEEKIDEKLQDTLRYDLDRALAECDPETRAYAMEVYGEIRAMFAEYVTDDVKLDAAANAVVYGVVSYMLNYAGIIERIVELNSDAEIILVGLMNTLAGMEIIIDENTVLPLGDIMNNVISSMNTYVAALPAAFQAAEKYEEATFYFAEATDVDMIVETMATEMTDTVRRRIIEELNDMVFGGLLKDLGVGPIDFSYDPDGSEGPAGSITVSAGFSIQEIDLNTVEKYEAALVSGDYSGLTANQMFSCALYLAFEEAICEASYASELDISAFTTLVDGLDGVFGGLTSAIDPATLMGSVSLDAVLAVVLEKYAAWLETDEGKAALTAAYDETIAPVVTATKEGYLKALNDAIEEINTGLSKTFELRTEIKNWNNIWAYMTADTFDADAAQACFEDELADCKADLGDTNWTTYVWNDAAIADAKASYDTVRSYYVPIKENENMLPLVNDKVPSDKLDAWASEAATQLLGSTLTTTVTDVLAEDEAVMSLLHLFARMLIGNGIGCHPNTAGHQTLFEAVKAAYEGDYTAEDATIDRALQALDQLAYLVAEYYDEAYAYGYEYALENGYIDTAIEALTYAENELLAIKAWIDANSGEMTAEFKAELLKEIDQALEAIAQLKVLILEANVLDQATLDEALELLAILEKNLDTILNLLDIAIDDISLVVYEELKARIIALNEYVENELIPAIKNAICASINYAIDYLRAQLDAAYNALVDAITDLLSQIDAEIAAILGGIDAEIIALLQGMDAELREILNEQYVAVIDMIHKFGTDAFSMIVDLVIADAVKVGGIIEDDFNDCVDKATHGEYTLDEESYYVAIGDSSAVAGNYADMLAAALGLDSRYANLATAGQTVEQSIAALVMNAEIIAKADLITIGYSNNTMFDFLVAQTKAYILDETMVEMDWADLVGVNGVQYIYKALDKVREELIAAGVSGNVLDKTVLETLMVAVESYAFAYATYVVNYPEMVATIRAINPEALVVSVGMSNNMADIDLEMNGMEIALGDYLQYVIDVANNEALAHAMIVEGVVYVDAPAVELEASEDEYDGMTAIIKELLKAESFTKLVATEAGNEYIMNQILNALTITDETAEYKLGDINDDGIVDEIDLAMLYDYIMDRYEMDARELLSADVNADGIADEIDLAIVYDYIMDRNDLLD